jgi:hypothetical protein
MNSIQPMVNVLTMVAAPITVASLLALSALTYIGMWYTREKRRRRMARSLQTAVRQDLRVA